MKTVMWAISSRGEPMLDTISESADAAIKVVADRIDSDTYEELTRLGFRLERVSVELRIVSQEPDA